MKRELFALESGQKELRRGSGELKSEWFARVQVAAEEGQARH